MLVKDLVGKDYGLWIKNGVFFADWTEADFNQIEIRDCVDIPNCLQWLIEKQMLLPEEKTPPKKFLRFVPVDGGVYSVEYTLDPPPNIEILNRPGKVFAIDITEDGRTTKVMLMCSDSWK